MSEIMEQIFSGSKPMACILAALVAEGARLLDRFSYRPARNYGCRMGEPPLRNAEEHLIRAKNAAMVEREFLMAAKIRGLIREIHDIQDRTKFAERAD